MVSARTFRYRFAQSFSDVKTQSQKGLVSIGRHYATQNVFLLLLFQEAWQWMFQIWAGLASYAS